MNFTLYTSKFCGNEKNAYYPDRRIISNIESMQDAVRFDHVSAEYKNNHRNLDSFLQSDVSVMDCDNDHSDLPEEWITIEQYEKLFPDVSYVIVPSRNNEKVKGNKTARPRYHIYFPHALFVTAKEEADLKHRIYNYLPLFDKNALDGARFIYGCSAEQIIWHPGKKTIEEFLNEKNFMDFDEERSLIHEGSRNATMSHLAGKIIKRYGITEDARKIYMERSKMCEPPLSQAELDKIWQSAVKFGKKVMQQDGYIPPENYNSSLQPEDFSDIGQAKVLSREYKGELIYTDATDYMRYNGVYWVESKQLAVGACEEFLDNQLDEAIRLILRAKEQLIANGVNKDLVNEGGKALEKEISNENAKAYAALKMALAYQKFALKRRDMRYIFSALQAAKPMLLSDIKIFDAEEMLLNTPKGTYDLSKGMQGCRNHCAKDYITKSTLASPDDVNEDLWINCVSELFLGDIELMNYVQQIVGLAAIGKVYQEALIIAYGEGCNGKSTFWNAIARVLGTYSGALSADTLTVGCKRNVKPEMAELKGKRLVIAAELEEGMRLNTSIVKQLCSTDEVSAEKKYKDPFKYVPTHTIVLYTNHLPRVGANDDGTWRRLIVIPFEAKIQGKADIKNYADYLVTHAGGAILKWIIEGAKQAIDKNFHIEIPFAVERAIGKYRENNDWLANFLDDCCDINPAFSEKSGKLYQEYRGYCLANGEYARGTADFYTALFAVGFKRRKNSQGSFIYGVKLKSDFMD